MTFSFHPEAEEEFRGAIEYYEDREAGLVYCLINDWSYSFLVSENVVPCIPAESSPKFVCNG